MPTDTPYIEQLPDLVLPDRLAALGAIATDLSWSWSRTAPAMFALIDPVL